MRKYAKYNVYWLIDAGSASPLRMSSINGTPAAGPLAGSHMSTLHHELDQVYLQSATGADGMDRWIFSSIAMGSGFAGGGVAKDFSLSLPGALSTGDLTIRLYSPYEMAHETTVSLNGSSIGSATWSGITWTEAAFAGVSLLDGANTVSLLCTDALDKTAADWFEVVYERAFEAASDTLRFTHAGGYRYRIADFTTNDVELYDITDAAGVQRVLNGTYSGSGPYTLEVEPAGATGTKSYLAVASAALKSPVAIVKDRASSLAAGANAADWIMITHRSLGWDGSGAQQGWVSSLVSLRQSQGLRTAVVDIEDVFDEFGYGLVTPQAVKDFITYAYESWQSPAPQYVLLVGDTSYDYKDNWASGTVNLVPGYLIYTTHLGETITDEWLVQVSGADAVPDLYIGRLPAATLAQAQAMVNKIVAYETAANTKGWEKTLVLAADNQAEEWEAVFETMNEDAAALLPAGMATPERFYLQEYENESACGDRSDRGSACCDRGRGAGCKLLRPRQCEHLGDRAHDRQPGGCVPLGCRHSDQQRQVPVRGEHELPDGLLHLSADGRLCGRLLAVARRGLAVAGERRGGGGPDADGDDGHRGPAAARPTPSTRRSSPWTSAGWGRRWATPSSSCWPTGVRSTSRRATPSCSSGTRRRASRCRCRGGRRR